jgi:hypothetical protein
MLEPVSIIHNEKPIEATEYMDMAVESLIQNSVWIIDTIQNGEYKKEVEDLLL